MKSRLLILPLTAAAIVGLSACSSQNTGTAFSGGSTSPTQTSGSAITTDQIASFDPCTLITPDEITKNGLGAPKVNNKQDCQWNRSDDGATIDGYVIDIVIRPNTTLRQLNTQGYTVSNYSVGKYQGKLLQQNDPQGSCMIALPIDQGSRIDMEITSGLGVDQACKLVKELATAVSPHFPSWF